MPSSPARTSMQIAIPPTADPSSIFHQGSGPRSPQSPGRASFMPSFSKSSPLDQFIRKSAKKCTIGRKMRRAIRAGTPPGARASSATRDLLRVYLSNAIFNMSIPHRRALASSISSSPRFVPLFLARGCQSSLCLSEKDLCNQSAPVVVKLLFR